MLFSLEADLARMRRKAKAENAALRHKKAVTTALLCRMRARFMTAWAWLSNAQIQKRMGVGFRSHEKPSERVISDG